MLSCARPLTRTHGWMWPAHARGRRQARGRGRVVAQHQPAERMRLVDGLDAERSGWIAGVVVVVAAHERDRQRRVRRAPGGQRLHGRALPRVTRMEQIAQDDEARGTRGSDHRGEPRERALRRALGHRHAELAEAARLADVDVGHQQGGVPGQQHRAFGSELEDLAGPADDRIHGGARGRHGPPGAIRSAARARGRAARWAGA
jgi:hypothetical protein